MTGHRAAMTVGEANGSTLLLVCRMIGLDLDVEELKQAKPAVYHSLQTHCRACADRAQCASDLLDVELDPAWQSWRLYCPNSATLAMLSRVHASCTAET